MSITAIVRVTNDPLKLAAAIASGVDTDYGTSPFESQVRELAESAFEELEQLYNGGDADGKSAHCRLASAALGEGFKGPAGFRDYLISLVWQSCAERDRVTA